MPHYLQSAGLDMHKRTIYMHKRRAFLEHEVVAAVNRGERCFIVSNSKKYIKAVHRMIQTECGDHIAMRIITSDNSRDDGILRFLANVKEEFCRIQVLLGTPSIGTGIDITFPNDQILVDRVFGFFYPFINTHTDIDQQLCRVRHPGRVDVWINPATFNFTSNLDVIMDDLARGYAVPRAVRGRLPDGMVDYDRADPLLNLCAHVTALQRASKNRLVELFCALRVANGWTVEWVDGTASTSPVTAAREILAAERAEKLLAAPLLGSDDYIELKMKIRSGANLSDEDRIIYERNHFVRKVGVPLDEQLVALNRDGKLLPRIHTLAAVLPLLLVAHRGADLVNWLLEPTTTPKGRLHKTQPEQLLAVLIRVAGLTSADGFDDKAVISVDSLTRFVGVCRDNRTMIEEILGQPLRNDFHKKPTRQLNDILKRAGLELTETKMKKIAGRKIRYYAISRGVLATMTALAVSYRAVQARVAEEKARALSQKRNRPERVEDLVEPTPTDDQNLISRFFLDP